MPNVVYEYIYAHANVPGSGPGPDPHAHIHNIHFIPILANIFNDKSLTRRKWAKIYTGFIRNRLRSELDEIWCPCLLMRVYRGERNTESGRAERQKKSSSLANGKTKQNWRWAPVQIFMKMLKRQSEQRSMRRAMGPRECRFVRAGDTNNFARERLLLPPSTVPYFSAWFLRCRQIFQFAGTRVWNTSFVSEGVGPGARVRALRRPVNRRIVFITSLRV